MCKEEDKDQDLEEEIKIGLDSTSKEESHLFNLQSQIQLSSKNGHNVLNATDRLHV